MTRISSFAFVLAILAGCADTGRTRATVDLVATGAPSTSLVDGAWTITLTRADVAFGPAYFCATAAASSELCTTAVVELLDAHTIDGLSSATQALGTLEGVTGTIRSAQYDFGIPFLLTQSMPTPLPGSAAGHSAILEGTATDTVDAFDFRITLDVTAQVSGTTAIVGQSIVADVPAHSATMTIAVDPREWLRGLDWATLAAQPHAPGSPVVIPSDSLQYATVLRAMTVDHPPSFTFTAP